MQNFIGKMLKMNKIDENAGGGSNQPPDPKEPKAPAANPEAPEEPGEDTHDELGYPKKAPESPAPGDKKQAADPKEKAPVEKPEKVENPATGYGAEPPKLEEPPAEDPNKKAEPPQEIDKKLEGLSKAFQDVAKKQITELGLDGEKLDKFIAIKRQEQKEAEEWGRSQQVQAEREKQLRHQQWHKELKDDPGFGGANFDQNVTRSEKVLDQYFSELKKELTANGVMLRPSVMRGLARVAEDLFPDRTMIQGDPPAPEKEQGDKGGKDDALAFYQ